MTNNICPSCGAKVRQGAKFCNICGATMAFQTRGTGDLSLVEYFVKCLKEWANFNGRARRKEYWGYTLFQQILYLGILFSHLILYSLRTDQDYSMEYQEIMILTAAPVIILFLLTSGGTKRFGSRWWAYLLCLLPITAFLYRCIYAPLLNATNPGKIKWPYYLGFQYLLFVLLFLLPQLAVSVRRLHDIGKSGSNLLWVIVVPGLAMMIGGVIASASSSGEIMVLPSIVCLICILVWLNWVCTEGNAGENQYGPDPKKG